MAMAKKKLNVEEIIELLKASYDGMPNFTPILKKGTIDTLHEINEKTVHSPEISTGYYGFCKKSEIVSELNRLFCELLLDIRANGDLHQHRRTEITRENGIERTRSYYNDVVKAWLYQFSRTNRPVEYKDKIIEVNLQPETSAYTPEITQTVEQPSHFFPADVNPSKPKNAHEVVMLMESYGTILAPETEQQEQAQPEASAQETTPATTEQQEPTTRDMLSKMTVKEIQAIARLVGVKNISKWSKSSLISRTSCMIHCAFDDIKATALKMTREDFMKIINITDTEYLSLALEELGYRSDLSREDCIKTFEEIFDDTNREAGRYNTLPHVEQEISEQEKERRQYEEFMQLDAKVKAAGTSSVLSTMEHFVYVSLLRQGFRQKHINDNEPTTLTSASTPAPVKINPEVKPDYDAAFDECAYTPDYQPNHAVLDDEPQPHRLIIKRRTAPAGRKLPTPKSLRQVYDFSKCADADTLRKALNAGSIDVVKTIAESYREFQPRTDGKTMTKKDYVTAIVRLYFPDYQPKKPAQEVKRDCMGREIIQCGSKFIPGKFYVAGLANYHNDTNPEPEFIKVIKRKNNTITVQVVSYPDFQPVFKPVSKKVKQFHYYHKGKTLALYESITLPNSHDYEGKDMRIASLCEYNAMLITTPGYDVDFDETAYSPDVQDVSVIVDDIPADHEPDIQPIQTTKPEPQPAPAEPERQQEQHHLVPLWSSKHDSYDVKEYKETRRQNKSLIDQCDSLEQIKNTLLTLNDTDMLKQAAYMRIQAQFIDLHGRMKTREEVAAEIAEIIIARRQRKAKAEARKSAPKQATRKPRHAVKIDDSRQILIQFDDEQTPAPESTPVKTKARRTHKPRVKRDYSRQILINFGENIPDGQTNQRKAA